MPLPCFPPLLHIYFATFRRRSRDNFHFSLVLFLFFYCHFLLFLFAFFFGVTAIVAQRPAVGTREREKSGKRRERERGGSLCSHRETIAGKISKHKWIFKLPSWQSTKKSVGDKKRYSTLLFYFFYFIFYIFFFGKGALNYLSTFSCSTSFLSV